jgi:hypothetical protein
MLERKSMVPMSEALAPNERWSLDFLSDTFGASRRFRIFAVNDDCCRKFFLARLPIPVFLVRVLRVNWTRWSGSTANL